MQQMEVTTKSAKETQTMARSLALEMLRSDIERNGALVVALEGNLGGGKTTFTQGFARGLGIKEKVLSPTFVLLKTYNLQHAVYQRFIHIDAYRLKNEQELAPLGWRDILKDAGNLILIEWADKIRRALPKESITISFEFVDKNSRKIIVSS